jgi:hypothetical protein
MNALIIVLSFAIIIQNTCPFGLTARTGFASAQSHHCHCAKKAAEKSKATADENAKHSILKAGQLFVFMIAKSVSLQLPVHQSVCLFCADMIYKIVFIDPLEKPPRFC